MYVLFCRTKSVIRVRLFVCPSLQGLAHIQRLPLSHSSFFPSQPCCFATTTIKSIKWDGGLYIGVNILSPGHPRSFPFHHTKFSNVTSLSLSLSGHFRHFPIGTSQLLLTRNNNIYFCFVLLLPHCCLRNLLA
jgi:hypothetical protein